MGQDVGGVADEEVAGEFGVADAFRGGGGHGCEGVVVEAWSWWWMRMRNVEVVVVVVGDAEVRSCPFGN